MFDWIRSLFGGSGGGWNKRQYDHYTEAVDDIKQLKRDRDHQAAEELLLWCIDQTEAEAGNAQYNGKVAPWYYRHLTIVYRKDDRYDDEVDVLERYVEVSHDLGNDPDDDLVDRLEKARSLAEDQ